MAQGFANVEKVKPSSRFMVGELVFIGWLAFGVTLTKLGLKNLFDQDADGAFTSLVLVEAQCCFTSLDYQADESPQSCSD